MSIIDSKNMLSDDDLLAVTGGQSVEAVKSTNTIEKTCPVCGKVRPFRTASGGRAFCSVCGEQIMI